MLMIQKVRTALLQSLKTAGVVDVALGLARSDNATPPSRSARGARENVPETYPELNQNSGSEAVLGALLAIGTQPNFAVRTSERTFRTYSDKVCYSSLSTYSFNSIFLIILFCRPL